MLCGGGINYYGLRACEWWFCVPTYHHWHAKAFLTATVMVNQNVAFQSVQQLRSIQSQVVSQQHRYGQNRIGKGCAFKKIKRCRYSAMKEKYYYLNMPLHVLFQWVQSWVISWIVQNVRSMAGIIRNLRQFYPSFINNVWMSQSCEGMYSKHVGGWGWFYLLSQMRQSNYNRTFIKT